MKHARKRKEKSLLQILPHNQAHKSAVLHRVRNILDKPERTKPYPEFVRVKVSGPEGLVGQVVDILKENFIAVSSLPQKNREDRGIHIYLIIKGPR